MECIHSKEVIEAPEVIEVLDSIESPESIEVIEVPDSDEAPDSIEAPRIIELPESIEAPDSIRGSEAVESIQDSVATITYQQFEIYEEFGIYTYEVCEPSEAYELSEACQLSDACELPEACQLPEAAEACDAVEDIDASEASDGSDASDSSEAPRASEEFDASDEFETSDTFEASEVPEIPEVLEVPESSTDILQTQLHQYFVHKQWVTEESRRSGLFFQSLLREMFDRGIETDVRIHFGVEQAEDTEDDFNCHAMTLLTHSEVFQDILRRDHTIVNGHKRLNFPHEHPHYFKLFIKMMHYEWSDATVRLNYHLQLNLTNPNDLVETLILAEQYLSTSMVAASKRLILQYFTGTDIPGVSARLFSRMRKLPICEYGRIGRDIFRKVENFVLQNAAKLFASNNILELSKSDICHLLMQDRLKCEEAIVYEGCCRWATIQLAWLSYLPTGPNLLCAWREIKNAIRYPLLDIDTAAVACKSGVLTLEERDELMAYKVNPRLERLLNPLNLLLDNRKRYDRDIFELRRHDIENISTTVKDFSHPHAFQVTASKNIKVKSLSLGFYSGPGGCHSVEVRITYGEEVISASFLDITTNAYFPSLFMITIDSELDVQANTPLNFYFMIRGGPTFTPKEVVPDYSNEIGVWVDGSIIQMKCTPIPGFANGLEQLPLMLLKAHESQVPPLNRDYSIREILAQLLHSLPSWWR